MRIIVFGNGTSWCQEVYHDLECDSVRFENSGFFANSSFIYKFLFRINYSKRFSIFVLPFFKKRLYKHIFGKLKQYD